MNSKKLIIKCPNCGCEYLAGEIYLPETFLGQPKNIIKDEKGVILGFEDSDMDLNETYFCDKCYKKFTIEALVTFKTDMSTNIFD